MGAEGRLDIHQPVLLKETIEWLRPLPVGVYVDGTVGLGGHAAAILAATDGRARLIGIDRDPNALKATSRRLADYAGVTLVHGNFRNLPNILSELEVTAVDGILLDVGVSSLQLDKAERGFSYQDDGPLDMRMDPEQSTTAATLVNQLSQSELTRILRDYGEERWAGRIAGFIVDRRDRRPFATTGDLAEVIRAAIPAAARRRGGHPARRTFQALRIAVNDELASLQQVLEPAAHLLRPGGRLVVISFHSLEDRLVKQAFRQLSQQPENAWRVLTRRPVRPSADEIELNPRARSARMRVLERLVKV